jgi:ribosomal protein S27AE
MTRNRYGIGDDPYVDVPLWENDDDLERKHGICERCGELTDDVDELICRRCETS